MGSSNKLNEKLITQGGAKYAVALKGKHYTKPKIPANVVDHPLLLPKSLRMPAKNKLMLKKKPGKTNVTKSR